MDRTSEEYQQMRDKPLFGSVRKPGCSADLIY